MARCQRRRFQEASRLASQAQEIEKRLEAGDVDFLVNKMGAQKAKQLFEDYLIKEMEYEALPEHEKSALQIKQENDALKRQIDAIRKRDSEAEKNSYLETAHKEIDDQVADALSKLGRKPTPRVVLRIVDDMIARLGSNESGGWDADTAAKSAISSIHQDIADYLGGLTAQEIVQVVPPEVLKLIRQHEVAQVMDTRSKVRTKAPGAAGTTRPKSRGFEAAFKDLEKRFTR